MITAQTLLGQFEEPFLRCALESVAWLDRFVITNTHPGDPVAERNVELARQVVPAEKLTVVDYQPARGFSFAEARNLGLAQIPDQSWVFWLDADDIHTPEAEGIFHYLLLNGADSITAEFMHFVVYRDAVQAVFPREVIYRKGAGTTWVGEVHETLLTTRNKPVNAPYRWFHASYIRGQRAVYDRWKFYSDLVGDTHHYDGQNPDTIIEDRVTVARRLEMEWPAVAYPEIDQVPVCPIPLDDEPPFPAPTVGLVMIQRQDDPDADVAIDGLFGTHGFSASGDLWFVDGDDQSLARALNEGFDHFRRQGYDYIGWVHPDMRFDDPEWLNSLLLEMRMWPRVGKVCAANTRDPLPAQLIDGHEQCYIIRRSVLDEVGLFDEGYVGIGGYEDWDLNRRIVNAGWRVCISPRARVFHAGMGTRSKRDTTADQIANGERYRSKWGTDRAPV